MDHVMLAPHNANSSPAAWERVHWNTIRNLLAGLGLPTDQISPQD
jgi:D-3-phosphoglycerate dehydrogenase